MLSLASVPQEGFQTNISSSWPTTHRGPPPCDLPSPTIRHVTLRPDDRLIVLSTSALSDALAPDAILAEALAGPNPMAAAKRLNQAVTSLVSDVGTCVITIGLQPTSPAAGGSQGKSVHFRITTDIDDEQADEAEAYKAWEYMLAQNHKMLFNRELETLHRTLVKGKTRHTAGHVADPTALAASGTARLGSKKKRYCYGQAGEVMPTNML